MRRPYEVKDWLRKQEWFEQYKNNVEKSTLETPNGLLSGRQGLDTICRAFNWSATPEGTDFWVKANDKFVNWYLKL